MSYHRKRFAVVGTSAENQRIEHLLQQTTLDIPFSVQVGAKPHQENTIGHLGQLASIIRVHGVNEVVFSGKDVESKDIIDLMSQLDHQSLDFKIAPPESLSIIGSNSIDTSGDLFILNTNSILKPVNRRNKRTLDLLIVIISLLTLPITLCVQKMPMSFLKNLFNVCLGKKTWIGYAEMSDETLRLPKLKPGVLNVQSHMKELSTDPELALRLNMVYARNYKAFKDLRLIFSQWRKLGS